ncbi:EAL domain-containing response regulator [Kistimonas asteriae]|uniref:EAL domain-containing response regulator n=1 Tax=Kistimonas asteriae TaxID=517724 RepID=UPI001BA52FD6|nr:EAL domain-containing response regulator [Kistimonas asteriae]
MNNDPSELIVIVVEEHDFQRAMAVKVLEDIGCRQVLSAHCGQDCLEKIVNYPEPVNIVFSQLDMSPMDGIELLRHLGEQQLSEAFVIVDFIDFAVLRTLEDMAEQLGLNVLGNIEQTFTRDCAEMIMDRYFDFHRKKQPDTYSNTLTRHDIIEGLTTNQFMTWYQPKVWIETGEWFAAEALSRWVHPDHGMIYPDQYIPVLEEMGVIDKLTWHQIHVIAEDLHRWLNLGKKIAVSINISPSMLDDRTLAGKLAEVTDHYNIGHDQLILEITESMLMENLAHSLETIARMKLKNFTLSMDDFGTGYSNLHQLERMPCSELKLDKSLVTGAYENPTRKVILESNIEMAQKLGMKTVGEGVETAEDWFLLEELGCSIGQGYLIGKSMPASDLFTWAADWSIRYKQMMNQKS